MPRVVLLNHGGEGGEGEEGGEGGGGHATGGGWVGDWLFESGLPPAPLSDGLTIHLTLGDRWAQAQDTVEVKYQIRFIFRWLP